MRLLTANDIEDEDDEGTSTIEESKRGGINPLMRPAAGASSIVLQMGFRFCSRFKFLAAAAVFSSLGGQVRY